MAILQQKLILLWQITIEGRALLNSLPSGAGAELDKSVLERFAGIVGRCGETAGQAGLPGLGDACLYLADCITRLGEKVERDPARERHLLDKWSGLVLDYLDSPQLDSPDEPVDGLLRYLQDDCWVEPLPDEDGGVLREILVQWYVEPETVSAEETAAAAETEPELATPTGDETRAEADPESEPEPEPAVETETGTKSEQAVAIESVSEIGDALTVTEEGPAFVLSPAVNATDSSDDTAKPSDVPTEEGLERMESITVDPDTLRLLQSELVGLVESLVVFAETPEETGLQEGMDQAETVVERLAMAAQAIGFPGLQRVCTRVQTNLLGFAGKSDTPPEALDVLLDWAAAGAEYLQAPQAADRARALADLLADSRWVDPLPAEEVDAFAAILAHIAVESGPKEERQALAEPEDVSLAVPDDINPELLEGLLQELPAQTTEFSETVERLALQGGSADIESARRIAHTLKGAANVVGIRGLANLTHQLEDILDALAKFGNKPPSALVHVLIDAADCLAEMNDHLIGHGAEPTQTLSVLQNVLDWANRIDREGILGEDAVAKPESPSELPPVPVSAPSESDQLSTPAPQQVTPMLRVPATLLDDLLRLAGESIILSGRLQENVLRGIRQAQAVHNQNQTMHHLIQELEHLVDVQGISLPGGRVDTAEFDPLEFEQYNELYTVVRRLQEVATDSRELSQEVDDRLVQLKELLVDQIRLNHEHQEATLLTRMVPVKTVEQRLQRGVRQACRLTGKSASLVIAGRDTLIESNVLNDLIEPLMHVLRNAVDHGIEDTEAREQQGKTSTGRIDLTFAREGNHILVRCEDDGAGLNYDAIRHKASERGLLKPGFSASEDELHRILLSPGFSTKDGVTQVSGRGIGMDVVQTTIAALKGSMSIQSHSGNGCRVELRLPVTLLSTQALLVRARQRLFAVSERGVQQILHADIGRLGHIGDVPTFETEEEIYRVKELDSILGFPSAQQREQRASRPVILVEMERERTLAVLVDEVVDSRELVVKPMGEYIPRIPGIPGATILGDGSIVPVLDLPELLGAPAVDKPLTVATEVVPDERADTRTALVVDDSLSARRSLAQFVKDAGFNVRTAIDGMEAIGIVETDKPDIVLADMEMPRMNGIELTAHLRANPETADLPVIMITSRSTDKHRRQADEAGVNIYLMKPFSEERLSQHLHELLGEVR